MPFIIKNGKYYASAGSNVAEDIIYDNTESGLSSQNVNDALDEITEKVESCFQSASDGKALIASAITGKGIETDATATFAEMAENIENIETGSTLTIEYELIEVSKSESAQVAFTLDRVTGIYGGLVKESSFTIPSSPISAIVGNQGYCLDGTNNTIKFISLAPDKYFSMSAGTFHGDYKFMIVNDPNQDAIYE